MDITQELAEKRRLEYERDYDLLTTLLNRRAFYDRVKDYLSIRSRWELQR